MIKKKFGAILLSIALISANMPVSTAMAVSVKETSGGTLDLEKIKNNAIELYNSNKNNDKKDDGLYNVESTTNYKPNDEVRVIVTLKNQNENGRSSINSNQKIQAFTINEMKSSNVDFDVRYQFVDDVNTMTGDIKYKDIEKIKKLDDVVSVRLAKEYHTNLQNANTMVQAQKVWDEYGYKGEGMAVAVLDTGFQVDHPDFKLSDSGRKSAKLTKEGLDTFLNKTEVDDVYYNEKVPTGYDWANKDNDISPLDPYVANHGMHVAGIVGANGDVENGGVRGIAPEVQIIGEKVFADDGRGYEDDIISGINHAVEAGADVINMSLGSDAGFVLEDSDLMQISIEKATKAGVLVVVSAANAYHATKDLYSNRVTAYAENFDIGTVGDPAVSSYALAVASADNTSITANIAELSNGEKVEYLNQARLYPIATNILGDKEYEVVKLNGTTYEDFEKADCEGKVVVISVDNPYYINSSLQSCAKRYGAVGIMAYCEFTYLYNVNSYYNVPVVSITKEGFDKVTKSLDNDSSTKVKFTDNTTLVSYKDNIEASEFSSWGTTATLDFKPEVSGVGGDIYSTTPDGEHTLMSGTSMSSPQVAGAAALLLQSMKEENDGTDYETVMDAKNILMNNTSIIEDDESKNPYSPRKQGSGLIQLGNALKTSVIAYNANADIQKKGAFALKEVGNSIDINLGLKSLISEDVDYDLYVELYTDERKNQGIDINLDGVIDFDKEINTLKSRKINGASISVGGKTIGNNNPFIIEDFKDKKVVPISIDLTNSDIDKNSFVEGFIRVVPKSDKYEEVNVPLMGFYGDWNDALNIDEPMVDGQPFAEYTAVFGYDQDTPLGFSRVTSSINKDKIAFSPIGYENLVGPRFTVLRNLEKLDVYVEDKDGNVVKKLYEEDYISKNTFYNRNIFYDVVSANPWDGTNEDNKIVEDGVYNFVIQSKFAYEGSDIQKTKMSVKVDSTNPTVKDVDISKVDDGYEIKFNVDDETSGFDGAILFIDNEYISLASGETSYLVENMPKEVVVIGFDNAGNAGLGVYGDSKEVSAETLLLYYSASGEYVNYENPCYIFGATQKPLIWKLSIVGPTGDTIYELDEVEESIFNIQFAPEKGEPNGQYLLRGYILDRDTGIYAKLDDFDMNVQDNEVADKTELFNAIMDNKEFVKGIVVGENPGQYTQDVLDDFNKVLEEIIDVYYDASTDEDKINKALEDINNAKLVLESKVNPSEGKVSALKVLDSCDELIKNAVIGDRPGNYSKESVECLTDAMKELQDMVNSTEEISDEQYHEAIDRLNVKIKEFTDSVVKAADVENIQDLLNAQKQYVEAIKNAESEYKYSEDVVKEYESLLNKYESSIKEPLRVDEADNIYKELMASVKEFDSNKIDITGLKDSINNAKEFLNKISDKISLYDEKSVNDLKDVLTSSDLIVSSPYTTKEEVSTKISSIKKLIVAIEDSKKEEIKPVEPPVSEDDEIQEPSVPDDEDNNTDEPDEDVSEDNTNKDTNQETDKDKDNSESQEMPETGRLVGSSIIFLLGFMGLAAGVVISKRRRQR